MYTHSMAASKSYYRFFSNNRQVSITPPDHSVFELDESDIWNSEVSPSPEFHRGTSRISRNKQYDTKSCRIGSIPASLPVNVPDWSKILKDEYIEYGTRDYSDDDEFDDGDEVEIDRIPPHEYLAKQLERRRNVSYSVHEGVGRTLKGRDLSRVRNAIWKKTGFQD